MQINLSGHHVEVTDSMRTYVEEKFAKLERHFDHVSSIQVIMSVEKHEKKVEASVHIAGHDVFAEAIHADMYAAIDSLASKLDRQVIKQKEKIKSHRGGNGHRDLDLETEESEEASATT